MATTTSPPERPAVPDDADTLREKQVRQAEELLFSGPSKDGFAKAIFSGRIPGRCALPLSRAESRRAEGRRAGRGGGQGVRGRPHRCGRHRSRRGYPALGDRGAVRSGRAGDGRTRGIGRPRLLADGLLPDHGSHRRPLRGDRRLRQCASLDRAARPGPVRHARAAGSAGCPRWPAARSSRPSP